MTIDELKSDFALKGYHEVPFSIQDGAIQAAVDAFFDFLKLSDETKRRFGYNLRFNENDPNDRGSDLGYHFRQKEMGSRYDDKEYIHYNHHATERLRTSDAPPELVELLDRLDVVFAAAVAAARPVAEQINTYTGQPLADVDCPLTCLRIIKYDRGQPGEFLAKGHYDRCTFSLAIAESAPGLRIGTNPEALHEVEHTNGQALLFPSLFLEDKTGGEFRASWHDVIQKSEDAYRPDASRWSIVFFCVPNSASPYFKSTTRTKRT